MNENMTTQQLVGMASFVVGRLAEIRQQLDLLKSEQNVLEAQLSTLHASLKAPQAQPPQMRPVSPEEAVAASKTRVAEKLAAMNEAME